MLGGYKPFPGDLGYFRNARGKGHGLRRLWRVVGGVGRVGAAYRRDRIQARAEESDQCRQGLGLWGSWAGNMPNG